MLLYEGNEMELDELTQVVSVCLDCIEELKSENAVLKKTVDHLTFRRAF